MKKKLISMTLACLMLASTFSVNTVVLANDVPATETIFDLGSILGQAMIPDDTYSASDFNSAMQGVRSDVSVSADSAYYTALTGGTRDNSKNGSGPDYELDTVGNERTLRVSFDGSSDYHRASPNLSLGSTTLGDSKRLDLDVGKYRAYISFKGEGTWSWNNPMSLLNVYEGTSGTSYGFNTLRDGSTEPPTKLTPATSSAFENVYDNKSAVYFTKDNDGWVNLYYEFERDNKEDSWNAKLVDINNNYSTYYEGQFGANTTIGKITFFSFWRCTQYDITFKNIKLVKINSEDASLGAEISFEDINGEELPGNKFNSEVVKSKISLVNNNLINQATARIIKAKYIKDNFETADFEDIILGPGETREYNLDLTSWTRGSFIYNPMIQKSGYELTNDEAAKQITGDGGTLSFAAGVNANDTIDTSSKARYDLTTDGTIKAYLTDMGSGLISNGRATNVKINLDKPITSGSVSVYAKLKNGGDTVIVRHLMKIGSLDYAFQFNGASYSKLRYPGDGYTLHDNEITVDADNYISLCCRIDKTNSGFDITITDEYNNHAVVATATSTLASISDITLFSTWPGTGEAINASDKYICVKDIKVTDNNDISKTADSVKVFVWYADDSLTPVCPAGTIEYDENRIPSVIKPEATGKVEISSKFTDSEGNVINSMKDNDGICATVTAYCDTDRDDISAKIDYMRGGTSIYSDSKSLVFTNGSAEINLVLPQSITPQAKDSLVLTAYEGTKEILRKNLGYNNLADTVDVLLVAGQSNAEGQGGNAEESLRPELNTVYYNTMGNTMLTTSGNKGWDSSLGKTWHELTGHTVLIVKAAWGGTGFPTKANIDTGEIATTGSSRWGYWNPDNTEGSLTKTPYNCYSLAQTKYNNAVNSIDREKYTIGNCLYFWCQGSNESKSYTADEYEEAFLELHEKLITEFGTEDTRLKVGGIVPIRSSYGDGFPNLALVGPRIAHYKLSNTRDDIHIVSVASENWYSNASIKEWFNDGQTKSWPDIMTNDNVHWNQKALNEIGKEAAYGMHAYIYGQRKADGIDLITPNGIRHYKDGDDILLEALSDDSHSYTKEGVIPVPPALSGTKAEFVLSGNTAEMDENGVITAKPALQNDYSILTVKIDGQEDMTFKVYSPYKDNTISISSVKDNKSAIYSLTTDDGYSETAGILDEQLEKHDLVATMGLIANIMGNEGVLSWDAAQNYVANGRWGVANHTLNHKQGEFLNLTETELDLEINGGRDSLLAKFPTERILGIYTPGGQKNGTIMKIIKENHYSFLGANNSNNSLPLTETSIYNISRRPVGNFSGAISDANSMNKWIDDAIQNGEWLCEMWHGVAIPNADGSIPDDADWGAVSSIEADKHLEYVSSKKDKVWVATIDEVIAYSTEKLRARINIISTDSNSLEFIVNDDLNDSIFNEKLTINIQLPEGVNGLSVVRNGINIDYSILSGVATFNVEPSVIPIKISWK